MEIHNLTEDLVRTTLDELFDEEEKAKTLGFCTCYQCRLDVTCYALNKVKPEYVVSGRGLAYSGQDYADKLQRTADIVVVIKEGWAKIDQTKRPHFVHQSSHAKPMFPSGPVFNFPSIIGRIFNGSNFEPFSGIQLCLYQGDDLVPMMDQNWLNPCTLVKNTSGTYIFWPYPETANETGMQKTFSFRVFAQVPGFEDISHYIELELSSEPVVVDQFSIQRVHKLPDLYLFPR
ncbi:MAG: late competence development ComFB family protein [Spirochaetes bacterium]|nr:late competence development ComFB family protein [Spirochaetota bacterium]